MFKFTQTIENLKILRLVCPIPVQRFWTGVGTPAAQRLSALRICPVDRYASDVTNVTNHSVRSVLIYEGEKQQKLN